MSGALNRAEAVLVSERAMPSWACASRRGCAGMSTRGVGDGRSPLRGRQVPMGCPLHIRAVRSRDAPRGPKTMPSQTSSASSSCRSFTRRSRSWKYGVTTFSIAFQAASEGSMYPPGRGPASKSSRSSACSAPKTSAATSANDTVASSAFAARLASEIRSGRDDRSSLRTVCASSPVRTSRQSYWLEWFGTSSAIRMTNGVASPQAVRGRSTE